MVSFGPRMELERELLYRKHPARQLSFVARAAHPSLTVLRKGRLWHGLVTRGWRYAASVGRTRPTCRRFLLGGKDRLRDCFVSMEYHRSLANTPAHGLEAHATKTAVRDRKS